MFFSKFKTEEFVINGHTYLIEDLTRKVANFPQRYFNLAYLDNYYIPIGARPDELADIVYGDPNYWWIFFVVNGITIAEWPLDNFGLEALFEEYGDEALDAIICSDHCMDDAQKQYVMVTGIPDKVINTISNSPMPLRQAILDINEARHQIKVVKPQFLSEFEADFFDKLNDGVQI